MVMLIRPYRRIARAASGCALSKAQGAAGVLVSRTVMRRAPARFMSPSKVWERDLPFRFLNAVTLVHGTGAEHSQRERRQ